MVTCEIPWIEDTSTTPSSLVHPRYVHSNRFNVIIGETLEDGLDYCTSVENESY